MDTSDNIDNIFTPGNYVLNPGYFPSGTFPSELIFSKDTVTYLTVEHTYANKIDHHQYIQTYLKIANGKPYYAKRRWFNGAWSIWYLTHDTDSMAFISSYYVNSQSSITITPRCANFTSGAGCYLYVINYRGGGHPDTLGGVGFITLWGEYTHHDVITSGSPLTGITYNNNNTYTFNFSGSNYYTLTLIYLNSAG